jgi:hypothetical protein
MLLAMCRVMQVYLAYILHFDRAALDWGKTFACKSSGNAWRGFYKSACAFELAATSCSLRTIECLLCTRFDEFIGEARSHCKEDLV